tara:strand:+ start:77 stop:235 length:159 start_codon:yes stop_codon:yes gene_type:complete
MTNDIDFYDDIKQDIIVTHEGEVKIISLYSGEKLAKPKKISHTINNIVSSFN